MEKLYSRWQLTGLLKSLSQIKVVMCEPRRGDQLEELMTKYYAAVRGDEGGPRGALFLAVYRGKISEGLDFSDNNARAVVAVSFQLKINMISRSWGLFFCAYIIYNVIR